MTHNARYPQFNDAPHERPALGMFSHSAFGELIWLLIPVAVVALGLLFR
jgi:hypothetical protein